MWFSRAFAITGISIHHPFSPLLAYLFHRHPCRLNSGDCCWKKWAIREKKKQQRCRIPIPAPNVLLQTHPPTIPITSYSLWFEIFHLLLLSIFVLLLLATITKTFATQLANRWKFPKCNIRSPNMPWQAVTVPKRREKFL